MRFLIIRHGDPYYPTDSLTEKGQREAELLSNKLIHENITKVYVSPLGRAKLTAKPTLDKLGMEATELPWLREFAKGLVKPYPTTWGTNTCPWNMPPELWTKIPGVFDPVAWREAELYHESEIPQYYDMVCEGFDKLTEEWGFRRNENGFYDVLPGHENRTDTVCLFCHLGLGNALLSHVLQASLPLIWHSLFLPTSSVTTIFMEHHTDEHSANARVVSVGDTSHLFAGGEPVSPSGLFAKEIR